MLTRKPKRGEMLQLPDDDGWYDVGVVCYFGGHSGNLCYFWPTDEYRSNHLVGFNESAVFIWRFSDCLNKLFRVKPKEK